MTSISHIDFYSHGDIEYHIFSLLYTTNEIFQAISQLDYSEKIFTDAHFTCDAIGRNCAHKNYISFFQQIVQSEHFYRYCPLLKLSSQVSGTSLTFTP